MPRSRYTWLTATADSMHSAGGAHGRGVRECRPQRIPSRDVDDDQAGDLAELRSLDPVDQQYVGEGRELGRTTDQKQAILLAETLTTCNT